jgi:DNA-binding transcriptional regulator YdaS (Cro superfamily)
VATGTKLFGKFSTEKTSVIIVNEEDSSRLVQDRMRLLNITDISLPIYYRIANGSKLTEEFVDSLIAEAKEKDVGLIMFDSLRSIHEAKENESDEMQGIMDLFKKMARAGITVIFTHHNRKKSQLGKGDDAESTRGSSAINAAVSGHISLEEVVQDDGRYLIVKHLKSKVSEKEDPFDVGIEIGDTISFRYLGEHSPKEQALGEAKNKILEALQGQENLLGRKDFVF